MVILGLEQLGAQPPDERDVCLGQSVNDGLIQRKELPPARDGERVMLVWQWVGLCPIVALDDACGCVVHDPSDVAGSLEGSSWLAGATSTLEVPVLPQDGGTLQG